MLFNPQGDDKTRQIIGGNITNVFNLNDVRYKWATNLYRDMMGNFWIPERTSLVEDKKSFSTLTSEEKEALLGTLGFLIFLDSIQTLNVPNIFDRVSAPELKLLGAIQTYQEAIHSQSYQYIVESIFSKDEIQRAYYYWRDDPILLERVSYIANMYDNYLQNPSEENFVIALIANYLLESLYFYNGFQFFYTLASRNKMLGVATIIKQIQRDELTHVTIFQNILKELYTEKPELYSKMEPMIISAFQKAVEQELTWSNHILGDFILGMSKSSIKDYTYYLANRRLKAIKLENQFPICSNPYKHLEKIADSEGSGTVKTNVFEASSSAYKQMNVFDGWDLI